MDFDSLILFARVIEANSFSEAARRLGMPVSTVSRRVAELEERLGVRLLVRSTRRLRPTEIGSEVLAQARLGIELGEAVAGIVSNHRSEVAGVLRLSSPPSLSDSLLAPLIGPFQASYPDVRVQVLVSERFVDPIADAVELAFRVGPIKDPALVARKILTYRHQLVASPAYLRGCKPPEAPRDLLDHRLLAFSRGQAEDRWTFAQAGGKARETLAFRPCLSMNDYAGLAAALLAGVGVGELPPLVQPDLLRSGRLVELMPGWRFRAVDLSVAHLADRHLARPVRVFRDFAERMAPTLFPSLPT